MHFIRTETALINSTSVLRIERIKDGKSRIITTNGDSYISLENVDELQEALAPIVPNSTEIVGVEFVLNEDETDMVALMVPIIAWRITLHGAVGIMSNGNDAENLVMPDGRVDNYTLGSFPSINEALAEYRANWSASRPGSVRDGQQASS